MLITEDAQYRPRAGQLTRHMALNYVTRLSLLCLWDLSEARGAVGLCQHGPFKPGPLGY